MIEAMAAPVTRQSHTSTHSQAMKNRHTANLSHKQYPKVETKKKGRIQV